MLLDVCTNVNVSMLKPLSRVANFGEWDVSYGLLTILAATPPFLDRRRALVHRGSGSSLLMSTASQKRVRVLQRPPGSTAKAAPKPATRSLPRPKRQAQLAAVRVLPRVPGAVSVRTNRAAVLRERLARRKYTASLGLEAKRSRDTSDESADPDRGEVNNTGDIVETALILGGWGHAHVQSTSCLDQLNETVGEATHTEREAPLVGRPARRGGDARG